MYILFTTLYNQRDKEDKGGREKEDEDKKNFGHLFPYLGFESSEWRELDGITLPLMGQQ